MKYRKAARQQAGGSLYSVMAETPDTQHAKEVSQIQSQVVITHAHMTPQEGALACMYNSVFSVRCHYWDYNLIIIINYIFIIIILSFIFICDSVTDCAPCCPLQVKYKEEGQKELWSTLFSSLPQTLQTELAKEVTELQSQVTKLSTIRNIVSLHKNLNLFTVRRGSRR